MIVDVGALILAGLLTVGLLVIAVRYLVSIVRTGIRRSRKRMERSQAGLR